MMVSLWTKFQVSTTFRSKDIKSAQIEAADLISGQTRFHCPIFSDKCIVGP